MIMGLFGLHIMDQMLNKFFILIVISLSILSCKSAQERSVNLKLTFDEVILPIPRDLTNDWAGASFSFEEGKKILHIYDPFKKDIALYSVEDKGLIERLQPFSDTLDPGNVPVRLKKIKNGYVIDSPLQIFYFDDDISLISKWDTYIPMKNKIVNRIYGSNSRLNSSGTLSLSLTSNTTIPLGIELANVYQEAVFRNDFYEFDILGNFDFTTGKLTTFPIRFPENFNQNGKSYPTNFKFTFVGLENSKIAYSFGIDENIHVLDVLTGEIDTHFISNPHLPLKIYPIDKASYIDKDFYSYQYLANYTTYRHLFYNPHWHGLLRMSTHVERGIKHRIFELINSNWEIIGQFEFPSEFSVTPIFFPNEIWFPYQLGYKPDEMKYYKVTLGE